MQNHYFFVKWTSTTKKDIVITMFKYNFSGNIVIKDKNTLKYLMDTQIDTKVNQDRLVHLLQTAPTQKDWFNI